MPVATYDAVVGAYNIRQVVSSDYKPDIKHAPFRNSGAIDPSQIIVLSGEPMATIETMDLAGMVAGLSATAGLLVNNGTITIPLQQRANGGTFSSNGSHYALSAAYGLLIPTEISASQDAEAGVTAKMDLYIASSDGLTDPVSINASQTLAAQAFVGTYSLGPAKINGTVIPGLTSWTYKFGIECQKKRFGGGVYPTLYGINITTRDPSIELEFEDEGSLDAFDHYLALDTTAAVYARLNVDGGTRAADGSSSHFAATLTGGLQFLSGVNAKGQDNGSFTRTIVGKTQAFSSTAAIA